MEVTGEDTPNHCAAFALQESNRSSGGFIGVAATCRPDDERDDQNE
jgi:hypothetical protein